MIRFQALLMASLLMLIALGERVVTASDKPEVLKCGKLETVAVSAGDSVAVRIPIRITKGMHVNANPASSEDYIPLEVKLPTGEGIRFGPPLYPKGRSFRLAGTSEDLLVYDGSVEITIPLWVASTAAPGTRKLAGTIEFQACDNNLCWMPDGRPFAITVKVLPRQR